MTCIQAGSAIVCTGTGRWRVGRAACPWCWLKGDELRRSLVTPVFGGWCGHDLICGNCGQSWSSDDDRLRKLTDAQRDENIGRVAAVPDPKCWACHDTGDKGDPGNPLLEEADPCSCGAGA